MWPAAGFLLVLGGLLPSSLMWLRGQQADWTLEAASWRAAATYNAIDSIFVVTVFIFLWVAGMYENARGLPPGSRKTVAPYPGAWAQADGSRAAPQGFPQYLAFAFVVTVISPSLALLWCLLSSEAGTRACGAATLAPYLLVFAPQILLETKVLNRSVLTPVLPLVFAYYRLWQFIRSLSFIRKEGADFVTSTTTPGQCNWLLYYLLLLLCFWVFDTGCTLVWLPGMYEWQLQDAEQLARICQQQHQQHRQQQQQQHQHQEQKPGSPADTQGSTHCAAASGGPVSGGVSAARLRHRWRLAGGHAPASSYDFDSYTFGT